MMFADKYTINQLADIAGLDIAFVRRCVKKHNELFQRYISRGDNNSLLFNSEGMEQFKRIGELKRSGKTLPEITSYFEEQETKAKEMGQAREQKTQDDQWLEKYIAEKDRRLKESEESHIRILELERLNAKLQSDLKLLPFGKTPEEIKAEWEAKQEADQRRFKIDKQKIKLLSEYKATSVFKFRKRKLILKKLESLLISDNAL